MVKNNHEERGFILVLGVIIASFLLLLVVPFMFKVSTERTLTKISLLALSALSLAEAGIERAIWEMNEGDISTWSGDEDLRTMDISNFQASGGNVIGQIQISVADPRGDNPVLEATGTVAGSSSQRVARTIRVELQYICPIPAPENAINILGNLSTKSDFKLFDHIGNVQGKILISGLDHAEEDPGPGRLALGVEDSDTLDQIIEELAERLDDYGSGELEGIFEGNPTKEYIYEEGPPEKNFNASIGLVDPGDFIDCATMQTYVQTLADNARSMLTNPNLTIETYNFEGKDKDDESLPGWETGTVNLGGTADHVVYMTNGKIKLEDGLTINGTGTLIVDGGRMEMKDVASFNWDGDIYILGDVNKGDAEFKCKKGNFTINGDIYVLGSDNGKAKVEFDNDLDQNIALTEINGSILASGGAGGDSKVELKIKNGDLKIQGMISLIGTKTKLEIRQKHKKGKEQGEVENATWLDNNDSDFLIQGGISIMVPEADKGTGKADIKIHDHKTSGDDEWEGSINILYDSSIIKAAVKRMAKAMGMFGRYSIVSWQMK
jgi:hypothetical protein